MKKRGKGDIFHHSSLGKGREEREKQEIEKNNLIIIKIYISPLIWRLEGKKGGEWPARGKRRDSPYSSILEKGGKRRERAPTPKEKKKRRSCSSLLFTSPNYWATRREKRGKGRG